MVRARCVAESLIHPREARGRWRDGSDGWAVMKRVGGFLGVLSCATGCLLAMGLVLFAVVPSAHGVDHEVIDVLEAWSPTEVLTGSWKREEGVRFEVDSHTQICQDLAYGAYRRADQSWLQTHLLACPSPEQAATRVLGLANEMQGASTQVKVEGNEVIANNGIFFHRTWAQGDLVVRIGIACTVTHECEREVELAAADLQSELPGDLVELTSGPAGILLWAIQLVFVVWLVLIVLPRIAAWMFQPRLQFLPQPPLYMDASGRVLSLRLRRVGRRISVVVAVLSALVAVSAAQDRNWARLSVSVAFVAASLWARRGLDSRLFHSRHWRGSALHWSVLVGWLVTGLSIILTVAVLGALVLWFFAQYYAQAALYGPEIVRKNLSADGEISWWDETRIELATVVAETVDAPETLLIAVVPTLIAIGLLDRLGRRLRARSADQAMKADPRSPVLYLRSFDEDKLKVRASLSRLGLIERLSPLRSRRFEEVLTRHLSVFGPVVGISPPDTRLAPLGAARVTLSNDTWRSYVASIAHESALVVMSATPDSVREGLEWEQALVAESLPHHRIILVVAPHKPADVPRRWSNFAASAKRWTSFRALPPDIPTGTHLLTPQVGGLWRHWGARRRSDWSYGVCILAAGDALLASEGGIDSTDFYGGDGIASGP